MGNSSQKKTNDLLDQQRQQQTANTQPIINTARDRSNTAYTDSQNRISGLTSGYQGLSDTGGLDPEEINRLRSTFGGGGGGSSVASSLSSTGGIDQSKFDSALAGYGDFASSGGGVDAAGIEAKSNRVIPSFYKNLQNEAERRRLVNPYSPSFDSESAAMARQAGQQTQENVRDTQTQIAEMVRQGREFGIKGLGDLNSTIQGLVQQGKIAGGQQEISNAGIAESAAARRQSGEQFIAGQQQSGRLAGLGGLKDLYDSQNQNAAGYFGAQANANTGVNGANLDAIRSRQNTTPWWQTVLNAGAGAAGSLLGGGGGLKLPKRGSSRLGNPALVGTY